MRQRELRVGDARRGQRADGEVEPVDHVPAFAKRIDDRPDPYEAHPGSRDDGEVLLLAGVLHRLEHALKHAPDRPHVVSLPSVPDGWIEPPSSTHSPPTPLAQYLATQRECRFQCEAELLLFVQSTTPTARRPRG